ncbi:NADPH-ferredoxin reductase FprA [Mycobacteroides abscessus subsp. abscessus]|nr:NADPH-ferredoxin reductase FprA [Mycobacteroides abscessus subsp. abscessus]
MDWPVQAVYRAVGYAGSALPQLPFDPRRGVIPNHEGRVVDAVDQSEAAESDVVAGVYSTGWIKRGPVGLIGHTKGDALETITHILADRAAGVLAEPVAPAEDSIVELLESKGVEFVDWQGYHRLDAAERAAGALEGRERVKIATREGMLAAARDHAATASAPVSGH